MVDPSRIELPVPSMVLDMRKPSRIGDESNLSQAARGRCWWKDERQIDRLSALSIWQLHMSSQQKLETGMGRTHVKRCHVTTWLPRDHMASDHTQLQSTLET